MSTTPPQKTAEQCQKAADTWRPGSGIELPDQAEWTEALDFLEGEITTLEKTLRERGQTVPPRPTAADDVERLDVLLGFKARLRVLISMTPADMAAAKQRVLAAVNPGKAATTTPGEVGTTATPTAPAAPAGKALTLTEKCIAARAAKQQIR